MTNSLADYIRLLLVVHIILFLVGCFLFGLFLSIGNYGAAIIVAIVMLAGFIYSKFIEALLSLF